MDIGTIAFILLMCGVTYFFANPVSKSSSIETGPDNPIPFGYKTAWIAIPSNGVKPNEIPFAKTVRDANWRQGIEASMGGKGFAYLSPEINGWTFIMGLNCPDPTLLAGDRNQRFIDFMKSLSEEYGKCFYFLSYRTSDVYAYSKFENGQEIRTFYNHEDITIDYGEITDIEEDLDLSFSEDDEFINLPTEDTIIEIASNWSINPLELDQYNCSELGRIIKF